MLKEEIKALFGVEVVSQTPFVRNDNDDVINLLLKSSEGTEYFLKEIQQHSMREGLDELFANLSEIKTDRFQLVLPIAQKSGNNKFLFEDDSKKFLLFKKENFSKFDTAKYSWEKLIDDLLHFQEQIKTKTFTKQDFRNYSSWINMGLARFNKNFGETPGFIGKFEKFMSEKFPLIQFEEGNIHWDIHEDNLALTDDGRLVLLDFDLVQSGAKVQDLLGAAGMYIDWTKARTESPEEFFKHLHKKISPYARGMEMSDMKFLLIRGMLGELALKTKEEAFQKLSSLNGMKD